MKRLKKTAPTASRHTCKWSYTNPKPYTIDFVMEPWGDVIAMPPGKTYEVIAQGPKSGELEKRVTASQVTVYAWPGSSLKVMSDGVDITNK
ncbi:MAG: hypothetical protein J4N92_06625 [Chloroflexi bacterium]|nr:hypothetical protein [Chloroflexota bacterium]